MCEDLLELLLYFFKWRRGKWDQHKILQLTWSIVRICPPAWELVRVVKLLMGLGCCWWWHTAAQERGSRNTLT